MWCSELFKMKVKLVKEQRENVDDDKLTIEDVIELGGDQVGYLAITLGQMLYTRRVGIFTETYRDTP